MKLAKSAHLLAVALALSFTVVGCKKGLDKTTGIPGQRPGSVSDGAANPPRDLQPTPPVTPFTTGREGTGVSTEPGRPLDTNAGGKEGIAAAGGNFENWIPNRDEFAAQTVHFEFDSAVVKKSEVGKLEEVAKRMKSSFQGKALRIEGHCDERGTEEYNRALGDRRALSVRETLVNLGLNPEMIPTITFGEEKPVDPGHNDTAFSKNRRGELILLSPPGSN